MAMLKPRPDEALKIWQVDKKVGNVRNKGAELALSISENSAMEPST
jgi:putative SOS response-associated peptidase YedK